MWDHTPRTRATHASALLGATDSSSLLASYESKSGTGTLFSLT